MSPLPNKQKIMKYFKLKGAILCSENISNQIANMQIMICL